MDTDISLQLQQQIEQASQQASALRIVGGKSKSFYGHPVTGETFDVSAHHGIINYQPTELVITSRAGTTLAEIEQLLDEHGQMLAFEPPAFGDNATIGGTIACNLSGPRRASAGAARDFVLGCKIINGKGEILSFGGEVMKNVAGYDVSRLMAGAQGTLGVLLEVSLKVLPKPEVEKTQQRPCSPDEALKILHACSQTPLPVSASSYHDSILRIRLSGAEKAVNAAIATVGGEAIDNADTYWRQLKEQQLDFFNNDKPLWRLSLASDASLDLDSDEKDWLYEWGGALRWLKSNSPAETIHSAAACIDGHATLFRCPEGFRHSEQQSLFQPLPPGLIQIHKNLKKAFDPNNILNPGRLYPDI